MQIGANIIFLFLPLAWTVSLPCSFNYTKFTSSYKEKAAAILIQNVSRLVHYIFFVGPLNMKSTSKLVFELTSLVNFHYAISNSVKTVFLAG